MQPANDGDTIDIPVSLAEIAKTRQHSHLEDRGSTSQSDRRTINEVMAEATRRLRRVGPSLAAAELRAGVLLVDTRSQAQRAAGGEVPGAVVMERNVLEWRLDPASPHRLPQVTGYDIRVIVMCAEGYSSVLAAVSLQDLGLARATDVIGGFEAWSAAGLPVIGGSRESVSAAESA